MPDDRADVVVVGSGAAGAALAWRLAEHGARVVCLEQGDWVDPASYASRRPDYETQLFRGDFHLDPNVRARPEDYPVVTPGPTPPSVVMFNGVGGSTIHWQGFHFRFHPSDFRVRTLDGVADDWPIAYRDLEPYYELNDRMMGVSGLAGDPANPPRAPRPTPPLPVGVIGETMARAFDRLGWHWWVGDNAIVSRPYDGRPACELHGKCFFGCPMGAKASTDVTYWPKALRRGAVLRTRARVREVTVDARGRATGVLYHDARGALHEQRARVVVVSCNGVGTPRLLLNSTSRLFPHGLANSNGVVGKYLMLHPGRYVEGLFERRTDGHVGPFGVPLYSQEFYETDASRGFVRGYTLLVERTLGPLSHALRPALPVPWGAGHHGAMRRRFPHTIGADVVVEDLPEERNRVELDPAVKDSSGIPAPRVHYARGENSERALTHGVARAREALQAAGAVELLDDGMKFNWAHLMGTARMGADPRRSVVDAWHRAHDVPNLFVVDGSSFTTAAGVNPTSTIGALALRAADGIWARRADWG
jgi:choline dehydrogenase-like flavoprotein